MPCCSSTTTSWTHQSKNVDSSTLGVPVSNRTPDCSSSSVARQPSGIEGVQQCQSQPRQDSGDARLYLQKEMCHLRSFQISYLSSRLSSSPNYSVSLRTANLTGSFTSPTPSEQAIYTCSAGLGRWGRRLLSCATHHLYCQNARLPSVVILFYSQPTTAA